MTRSTGGPDDDAAPVFAKGLRRDVLAPPQLFLMLPYVVALLALNNPRQILPICLGTPMIGRAHTRGPQKVARLSGEYLVGFVGRATAPAVIGLPYVKEES